MQSQDTTPNETVDSITTEFMNSVPKEETPVKLYDMAGNVIVSIEEDPALHQEAVGHAKVARELEEAACTPNDPRRVVDEHIADLEALEAGNAVEVSDGLMREVIFHRSCSTPVEAISIDIKVPNMNELFEDLDDGLPPPDTKDNKCLSDDEALNRMSGGGLKAQLDEPHEFLEMMEEFREAAHEDPAEPYITAYAGVAPAMATLMLVKELKRLTESVASMSQSLSSINHSVTELKEALTSSDPV